MNEVVFQFGVIVSMRSPKMVPVVTSAAGVGAHSRCTVMKTYWTARGQRDKDVALARLEGQGFLIGDHVAKQAAARGIDHAHQYRRGE